MHLLYIVDNIKYLIISSISKKIGNVPIRLESTPNARARLTIGTRPKDFVNQREALEWLIYAYNMKDFRNLLQTSLPQVEFNLPDIKRNYVLDEAAAKIFEKIIDFDYFSMEIYRDAVTDLEKLKTESGYSGEEVGLVYEILIESLKKLMDETFHQQRSQTYKKYLEQFIIRGRKGF